MEQQSFVIKIRYDGEKYVDNEGNIYENIQEVLAINEINLVEFHNKTTQNMIESPPKFISFYNVISYND